MFIEEKGKELLDKNLYRNFILHVCNLFEFGVLGPAHVFSAISRLQDFVRDDGHSFTSWPHQTTHWNSIPKEDPPAAPPKDLHSKPSRRDFSGIFSKDRRTPYAQCSVILEPVDNLLKNAEDEAKRVFLQKSSSGDKNAARVSDGSDEDLETKTEKPEDDDDVEEEEEIDDDESKNDTTPSNNSPAQTSVTEALEVKQQ